MNTPSKEERISRGVYLVTMCLAAFSCGAYTTTRRSAGRVPASSRLEFSSREDGGASEPTFLVLPEYCQAGVRRCEGPSCPFPGPEPGEEQHRCVTYIADEGRSVTMDKSTLGASSCNPTSTVLVQEYGQYLIEVEGERLDRLDHDVRLGEIGRVVACTIEPTDADGSFGDGYAISHVRVLQPGSFHFGKSGEFVADEQ
jgi:hypothetical protein